MLSEQIGCFSKRIRSDEHLLYSVEQVNQPVEIFHCKSFQSAMLGDEVSPDATHDE